ncbi:hypothetical protein CCACVL1_30419 [Corchorus capsularis]|uniref:Uncharacterized protein n=1 Tax=Corchorus capsularis TaxID=210143 RepID=A0A1R3FXA9_COCAP|nr:hypothetical protein CCACVL1_30419 [Corchorus capsularis]
MTLHYRAPLLAFTITNRSSSLRMSYSSTRSYSCSSADSSSIPMENNREVNELVVYLEEENVGDKTTVEELENEDAIGSKRQRKKTSPVWEEFIELKDANGSELVQCIHFKTKLIKQKTRITT